LATLVKRRPRALGSREILVAQVASLEAGAGKVRAVPVAAAKHAVDELCRHIEFRLDETRPLEQALLEGFAAKQRWQPFKITPGRI
jgi:hypothetical protein